MGLDQANPDDLARNRPRSEFETIARRFIRDLINGEEVNSRMNRPDIIKYARTLSSLPSVTANRIEPEPLNTPNVDVKKSKSPGRRHPAKPEKPRHVQYEHEIATALKGYGNYKLGSGPITG
jgi:hypothetical protein